jgi:hypothetical protein
VSIRNPRWPPPLGMGTYGENILKLFFNAKNIPAMYDLGSNIFVVS